MTYWVSEKNSNIGWGPNRGLKQSQFKSARNWYWNSILCTRGCFGGCLPICWGDIAWFSGEKDCSRSHTLMYGREESSTVSVLLCRSDRERLQTSEHWTAARQSAHVEHCGYSRPPCQSQQVHCLVVTNSDDSFIMIWW